MGPRSGLVRCSGTSTRRAPAAFMANVGIHAHGCLSRSCYCFERACALPRPNELRRRLLPPECPVCSRRQTARPIKCPCKACLRRKARVKGYLCQRQLSGGQLRHRVLQAHAADIAMGRHAHCAGECARKMKHAEGGDCGQLSQRDLFIKVHQNVIQNAPQPDLVEAMRGGPAMLRAARRESAASLAVQYSAHPRPASLSGEIGYLRRHPAEAGAGTADDCVVGGEVIDFRRRRDLVVLVVRFAGDLLGYPLALDINMHSGLPRPFGDRIRDRLDMAVGIIAENGNLRHELLPCEARSVPPWPGILMRHNPPNHNAAIHCTPIVRRSYGVSLWLTALNLGLGAPRRCALLRPLFACRRSPCPRAAAAYAARVHGKSASQARRMLWFLAGCTAGGGRQLFMPMDCNVTYLVVVARARRDDLPDPSG